MLNILWAALSDTFARPDFREKLHLIKALFVQRKFEEIFQKENLEIYAAEYASSRALAYYEIFRKHSALRDVLRMDNAVVYAIGSGCGSELIALTCASLGSTIKDKKTRLILQDMADYTDVVGRLEKTLRLKWKVGLERLQVEFHVGNVLDEEKSWQPFATADLIMANFIINELFCTSKTKTVKLILNLVRSMKKGALLCVIDSAGSFNEIAVNGKTYSYINLLTDSVLLRLLSGKTAHGTDILPALTINANSTIRGI